MSERTPASDSMIAAERRRRICELAVQNGSVKVASLSELLGIGENTVRSDLDILHKEGKLVRVHGGAIARGSASPRPPYSETRGAYMAEKSWIGTEALSYLPEFGTVFIGGGGTLRQFVSGIQPGRGMHIVTNSIEIAAHVITNHIAPCDFLGGNVHPETMSSDGSLSEESLERLYWDVIFMSADSVDAVRGITELDHRTAVWERKLLERAGKIVLLCDSSKIGRFSYVQVGPLSMADVLITDTGVNPLFVKEAEALGVEVVVAGPGG